MPLKAEGEFALVREQVERAFDRSGQPVKRGTMAHDHDLYMILTDTAAQLRDPAALQQYAPRLEELATRDGHRFCFAIAQRARGIAFRLTGDLVAASKYLYEALELFGAVEMRWQVGRTHFEIAELALAQSDPASARDHFAQALSAFEAMQATPDVKRTRSALDALGQE